MRTMIPLRGASSRLSPDLDATVAVQVLQGYRRLAIRVLVHAFRDLRRGSPELRLSALEFLTDHTRLEMWCSLAEIEAARVTARAMAQVSPVRKGRTNLGDAASEIQAVAAVSKLASADSSVS